MEREDHMKLITYKNGKKVCEYHDVNPHGVKLMHLGIPVRLVLCFTKLKTGNLCNVNLDQGITFSLFNE